MKAIYTEDTSTLCDNCCLNQTCPQEGYCRCDRYREDNNTNVEGDFYFVED